MGYGNGGRKDEGETRAPSRGARLAAITADIRDLNRNLKLSPPSIQVFL